MAVKRTRRKLKPKKQPEKQLSAVAIGNLKKPGRYTDGGCLHLVVDHSGAKRWVLRVHVHGVRRDIGLGGLRTMSLADAREEASRLRKIAWNGGDPVAVREAERRAMMPAPKVPTFEAIARDVHKEQAASFKNPKHSIQWITSLEQYVFPAIKDRPINTIDSADVLKILSPIWM